MTGWPNLKEAARRAALGKRSRSDVAAFLLEREAHLAALRRELREGSYQPAGYRTFVIHEPKPRQISTAPFRDRGRVEDWRRCSLGSAYPLLPVSVGSAALSEP